MLLDGGDAVLYAGDVMSADVVWITAQHTLNEAFATMTQFNVYHLPVVEEQKVVGLISKKELFRHVVDGSCAAGPAVVGAAMQRDVFTCPRHCAVAKVARAMLRFQLDAVPVVSRGELVGIITATDILSCTLRAKARIA